MFFCRKYMNETPKGLMSDLERVPRSNYFNHSVAQIDYLINQRGKSKIFKTIWVF